MRLCVGMPSATSIDDEGLAKQLSARASRAAATSTAFSLMCQRVSCRSARRCSSCSHCDPTVNLHDYFVGVRDGKVEALWEIDARGAGVESTFFLSRANA